MHDMSKRFLPSYQPEISADPIFGVSGYLFDNRQNLTIRETLLIVDYLGLLEGCFDDEDEAVSTT